MASKKPETKENACGKPGRSNRTISLKILLLFSLPYILFLLISLYVMRIGKIPVIFIYLIIVFSLYLTLRKIKRETERTYERGAEGEEKVFNYLRKKLPHGYYILNDVKIPNMEKANIDHIVIGPNGIFIIETKNLSGKVTIFNKKIYVRGKPYHKDIIKQVWRQTFSLRYFLKKITGGLFFKIQPVIVFPTAYVTNHGELSGVIVTSLPYLTKYLLQKSSSRLPEDLTLRLYEILKNYVNQPVS